MTSTKLSLVLSIFALAACDTETQQSPDSSPDQQAEELVEELVADFVSAENSVKATEQADYVVTKPVFMGQPIFMDGEELKSTTIPGLGLEIFVTPVDMETMDMVDYLYESGRFDVIEDVELEGYSNQSMEDRVWTVIEDANIPEDKLGTPEVSTNYVVTKPVFMGQPIFMDGDQLRSTTIPELGLELFELPFGIDINDMTEYLYENGRFEYIEEGI
jgi:hypothetical protein